MVDKKRPSYTVTGDIFDKPVMHHRIDKTVTKKVFFQLVMDLLIRQGIQIDSIIVKNLVHHGLKSLCRSLSGYLPGVHIHPLKDPFFKLVKKFLLCVGIYGLNNLVEVFVRDIVVGDTDVCKRGIDRIYLNLLGPWWRFKGEVDHHPVNLGIILLTLLCKWSYFAKKTKKGLLFLFRSAGLRNLRSLYILFFKMTKPGRFFSSFFLFPTERG